MFPQEIDMKSSTFVIAVNNSLSSFIPIPNCPLLFEPVEYNNFWFPSIIVWFLPAEICIIPEILTFVGIETLSLVPIPNCPFSLYPNVYTSPYALNNTLWLSPQAILPTITGTSIWVNVFDLPSVLPVCP